MGGRLAVDGNTMCMIPADMLEVLNYLAGRAYREHVGEWDKPGSKFAARSLRYASSVLGDGDTTVGQVVADIMNHVGDTPPGVDDMRLVAAG